MRKWTESVIINKPQGPLCSLVFFSKMMYTLPSNCTKLVSVPSFGLKALMVLLGFSVGSMNDVYFMMLPETKPTEPHVLKCWRANICGVM